ncbi:MAG TPA: hypothetical protein DDZ68_04100, partial [Parvularcula sp.]|nr:hypothetical protein [Parvularcula sp.]
TKRGSHHTAYTYNRRNDLTIADINDGRPRDVTYVTDLNGQIIRRDEADGNTSNGDPHERTYRFAGKQIGYVGNNGGTDFTYSQSIGDRTAAQGTGAFRNGQTTGAAYADFDQGVDVINSYGQGSGAGVYTARGGESLAQIAADLWGDSSLWYKLAEANGLSGDAALAEGQTLVIPTGVIRLAHNADTFTPYDPNAAIGNTSPTNAKPPKKAKCGILGQILLVVIAVAVTIATKGIAAKLFGFLGKVGSAVAGGAVAGAAGSIVSQGVGVVTGIQDKFSFKSVGLAAIGGAVGGGLGGDGLNVFGKVSSDFARGALTAGLSSAVTQGIGVATGLQSKFSFAGVAGAALGGGISARFGDFGIGGFGGQFVRHERQSLARRRVRFAGDGAGARLISGT